MRLSRSSGLENYSLTRAKYALKTPVRHDTEPNWGIECDTPHSMSMRLMHASANHCHGNIDVVICIDAFRWTPRHVKRSKQSKQNCFPRVHSASSSRPPTVLRSEISISLTHASIHAIRRTFTCPSQEDGRRKRQNLSASHQIAVKPDWRAL